MDLILWNDIWHVVALSQQLPELFSFSNNNQISVQELFTMENFEEHFHMPITVQAFQPYE
jgi:hypothetical protein